MKEKLLHTPEGVRDIYNSEFLKKETVEGKMKEVMRHYGFHPFSTPAFEYFDIFNKERGSVPAKDMYRFVDRDGELLVLRPDMTPQAARCVAKYFRHESLPIRLCYHGNVFVNYSGYQGKLKESTQIGAELYNDATPEADAEMAALMVDCLKASGLTKFQVVAGQADFFRALVDEAGFSDEETESLRDLIEMKNMFGVEQLLQGKSISTELKDIFRKLSTHFGSIDSVRALKEATKNERAVAALQRLEQFHEALCLYGKENFISYDLGMLNQFDYYTGIIFRAYTHGTGDVIAAGGRYDTLVGQFGKQAPAIGIAVYSDQILTALQRQGLLEHPVADGNLIVYRKEAVKKAIELAGQLREEGKTATLLDGTQRTEEEVKTYANQIGAGKVWNI